MRILEIRGKNLNSLTGEWRIDLTHPAYDADGIFAITGPTGAGKSTILDAICLALYGRTPRLPKIGESGNEIMSRQTGECLAEVTFATQKGRFRCHWSQRRAGRKADGKPQPPKHDIADADSGEIIAAKIREVAERVESATGMDFDRFTRSMLLAQGGFAAFLQAAPDDRAPILEQITGTEIYSRISMRVHERLRLERDKLNVLRAETAGIVILAPEQEEDLRQSLMEKQRQDADIAAQAAGIREAIAWLTAVDGLKKEIASLALEESKLQDGLAAFAPDRHRLDQALRAAAQDGPYATLLAIRKQQADDQAALNAGEQTLPALEAAVKARAESLQAAERRSAQAKEELQAALPIIQAVRSLDDRLAGQKKTILASEEDCRQEAARIDVAKEARLKERQERAKAAKSLEVVADYLKEHARDEWLIGGLTGVEEQVAVLLTKQQEIAVKEGEHKKAATARQRAAKSLDDWTKQCGVQQREVAAAAERLRQGQDTLARLLGGRLLREYRAEHETLLREMVLLTKIAKLENYRAELEDGKPCPLCGANEHPFAAGNVPVYDETERKITTLKKLIGQAEEQETAVRKLAEAEASVRNNLSEGEKRRMAAEHEHKAVENAFAESQKDLEKLRTDLAASQRAVAAKLLPLGIAEILDAESLLVSLKARLRAWRAQVEKKAEIEKQLAAFDSELKRLDAIIETQDAALAEKRERLAAMQKEYAAGNEERQSLYGDKNADAEEKRLQQAVADAEKAEKEVSGLCHELRQKWHTAKTQMESLRHGIEARKTKLQEMAADFAVALTALGFAGEEAFLAARLSAAQRDELAAKAKKLDDAQTEIKTRQKDREGRLAVELSKKITDKSLAELEPQWQEREKALQELRQAIAAFGHKLSENAAAQERIKEKQTAIEAQNRECRKWSNLHDLIGSADGKKYRNFAQGLTFEMVIGHANRQLRRMTDRYLLIRDDKSPLELNVIDSYQAGETRSTKNLSGGESFIVSLALALGLSHMSSKNVRVDSLFLDEGFGTLDEEALDTALEALAGLRQDGKLIGVISHVSALQERIGVQIQVRPQSGGRSRISGPGCSG